MRSLFVMITLSGIKRISPLKVVVALLLLHMHLPLLYAQEEVKVGQKVKVNFTFGPTISGVSNRIKKELGITQKSTPYSGFFGPSRQINYSVRPWVQLGAELSLKDNWSVKGAFSNWGGGYRVDHSEFKVSPSVNTFSGMLVWNPGNHTSRLAAGPAFHLITQKAGDYYRDPVTKKSGKAGFVLEAGWRLPAHSLFFAEFQIQYQHLGMVEFGPYHIPRHYIGSDPYIETRSFNDINMNILVIGFGLGLRL